VIALLHKAASHKPLAPVISRLLALAFKRVDFLLPIRILKRSAHCLAFAHPQPAYAVHILIVPREQIASLLDIDEEQQVFLSAMIRMAREMIAEMRLDEVGYRMVINGGAYQEIPLLHLHLIAGCLPAEE